MTKRLTPLQISDTQFGCLVMAVYFLFIVAVAGAAILLWSAQ